MIGKSSLLIWYLTILKSLSCKKVFLTWISEVTGENCDFVPEITIQCNDCGWFLELRKPKSFKDETKRLFIIFDSNNFEMLLAMF